MVVKEGEMRGGDESGAGIYMFRTLTQADSDMAPNGTLSKSVALKWRSAGDTFVNYKK